MIEGIETGNIWLGMVKEGFSEEVVTVTMLVIKSCLTLCHPRDCSLPGFSVNGILQERILEWVAIPLLSEPPGKPTLKVGKTISNWTVIGNNILSKKNSMLYIKGQKCVFLYNTFKGQIFHMRRKWDILWWRVRYYSELYIKTNSYWAIHIKMS